MGLTPGHSGKSRGLWGSPGAAAGDLAQLLRKCKVRLLAFRQHNFEGFIRTA